MNLLPMWLVTVSVIPGIPSRPPDFIPVGEPCRVAAGLVVALLFWRCWLAPELLPFDLMPVLLSSSMESVPPGYQTSFLLACAAILTLGGLIYGLVRDHAWRWLVIAAVIGLVVLLNANAVRGVWANLSGCFQDCETAIFPAIRASLSGANAGCYPGCVPDANLGVSWWRLFFGIAG